jgi:hypothetical protein
MTSIIEGEGGKGKGQKIRQSTMAPTKGVLAVSGQGHHWLQDSWEQCTCHLDPLLTRRV